MSWITFKEPYVLVATKPIKVCKVIKKDDHSLYFNYFYEKKYDNKKRVLSFDVGYCSVEGKNGYHSFATNFILHKNIVYAKNLMKMYEKLEDNTKLIFCEIPAGTKYAKNEFGEYISEKLIYTEDV